MPSLGSGDIVAHRFAIESVAGSGGMGTVYRAHDLLSGERVALKVLHVHGPDPAEDERFVREAEILSRLHHPGIVSYVAHGQSAQGQRFLAMQWLDGETLAQRLTRGPLSLSDSLALAQCVAEALAYAHQRGVLHRDLKPTNLFLPDGSPQRVRILDFGIARRLATSRAMTRTGVIVGTPEYMAPEQARGARELTPAADLFSLGCVLYECLAGEPPFAGEHIAAVLVRILFEEPASLLQRRPGLPEKINKLVGRLLAKQSADRMADAGELAVALRSLRELPDLSKAATLTGQRPPAPGPSDGEQVLLSLVLSRAPQAAGDSGEAEPAASALAHLEQRGPLLSEMRALGMQADFLLGGALVATVSQMPSAKDQATLAVRCAAMVKEHWPQAQVVVVTGRGARRRSGLTGEVLDRAWRLLEETDAAAPATGPILVDEVSASLLGTRYELEPLPAGEGVFALGSERLDADTARLLLGKPTPCVGRDVELATLEAVYNQCKEELLARAILVTGPPGLGKSRLRHEFLRRLQSRGEPGLILFGRGDPMKTKSAYGLLGEALRQHFELHAGQSLDEQQARIRRRVSAVLPAGHALRVTVFIGELCGVPFPDDEHPQLRAARQDPYVMSEQVDQAWLDAQILFHSTGPLLLVLEDLHWCDARTVKLVGLALRSNRDHAFMVLALSRPEVHEVYPNLWPGAVQQLPLHSLSRKASERLVRQILGQEVAAQEALRIVEQAAGNPLFLEELIRAAAERNTRELPETVAAMIQARIGALPANARRNLRAASIFGETFWESGVRELMLATHGEEGVQSSLGDLIREEIIEKIPEWRISDDTQYRFRHALVRDAAYGLVVPEERVPWHVAAGRYLEREDRGEAIVLAEHYRLGNEPAQALRFYVKAGEELFAQNDLAGALRCVEAAKGCGADGALLHRMRALEASLAFWMEGFAQAYQLGSAALPMLEVGSYPWCKLSALMILMTGGVGNRQGMLDLCQSMLAAIPEPAARAAYVEATTFLVTNSCWLGMRLQAEAGLTQLLKMGLFASEDDPVSRAWVHFSQSWFRYLLDAQPWQALAAAEQGTRDLQLAGWERDQVAPRTVVGISQVALGDGDGGVQILRESVALAQKVGQPFPISYSRIQLALALSSSIKPEEREEAGALAQLWIQAEHPPPMHLGISYHVLARVAEGAGDLDGAEAAAQRASELLTLFPPYRILAMAALGSLQLRRGDLEGALATVQSAEQELQRIGGTCMADLGLIACLAEAQARAGMREATRQTVQRGVQVLRRRAGAIPDTGVRARYLRQVQDNVRLLRLAQEYGLAPDDLASESR